ncbi:MAG: hypothetical protein JNK23_10305 [Opitutaceae bacterium]|nr:hypothetical protein [Opitutaceae bacterium]
MTSTSCAPHTAPRVADSFWPRDYRLRRAARTPRTGYETASNLYELFVLDVSLVVAGACQADRMARVFFSSIPSDQIPLRELVLGLVQSARGCLPALPSALSEEGVVLYSVRDRVVEVLLKPVGARRDGATAAHASNVIGARLVGIFADVAQHLESIAARAGADARLLGSDRLNQALLGWAEAWRGYRHDLHRREQTFRAQAYAAGLDLSPRVQSA